MDGLKWFAQGQLITLFSAINYCGTANNAGAILVVCRGLVIVPKLIHPLPPPLHSPETSPERVMDDTWMQRERHSVLGSDGINGKNVLKPIFHFQTWRIDILFFSFGNCLNFISFGYAAQPFSLAAAATTNANALAGWMANVAASSSVQTAVVATSTLPILPNQGVS